MSVIGIIAALPREVAPLVKGWRREELPGRIVYLRGDVVVACAGMGPMQAGVAVQAVRALAPVEELISIGLAGACDPRLKVGDVVRPGVIVDRRTGERYMDERQHDAVLVSTDAVVSVAEKERLHVAYDAAAVDMEAATVARLARAHGFGFRAVKAISDTSDFEIAWLAKFATPEGQFREGAFAFYASLRPWTWGKVRRLAKSSSKALRTLHEAVRAEIE